MIKISDTTYSSYYSKQALVELLKRFELPYSGNKQQLIDRANKNLKEENIEEFKLKAIKEGNRHIYTFSIEAHKSDLEYENDLKNSKMFEVLDIKDRKELKQIIISKNTPVTAEDVISDTFGFVALIEIRKGELRISTIPYAKYISEAENKNLIFEIRDEICKILKVNLKLSVDDYSKVLTHIWELGNHAIYEELKPYTSKVSKFTDDYTKKCFEELGIDKDNLDSVENRLLSIWQFACIENKLKDFNFNTDYGIITSERFSLMGGTTVNVSAGKGQARNKSVYIEPFHYDIKGTINSTNLCKCKKLKFKWLYKTKNNEEKYIETTMECLKKCFVLKFIQFTQEEEIEFVFSKIREIKRKIL